MSRKKNSRMHFCGDTKSECCSRDENLPDLAFRVQFLWDPLFASGIAYERTKCLNSIRMLSTMRIDQETRLHQDFDSASQSGIKGNIAIFYDSRGQSARQFVESAKAEIVSPIDNFISRHKSILETLGRDTRGLLVTLQKLRQTVRTDVEALDKCVKLLNGFLRVSEKDDARSVPCPELYIQFSKVYVKYKDAVDARARGNRALEEFIEKSYKPSITTILNMYEDFVKSSEELYTECVNKLILFEVSLNRGIQYDLNGLLAAAPDTFEVVPTPPKTSSDCCVEPLQVPVPLKHSFLTFPSTSQVPEIFLSIKNHLLSTTENVDPNLLETLRSCLSSHSSRMAVLQSLIVESKTISNDLSFSNLGRSVWILLDESMDTDALVARRILVMARTVSVMDEVTGRRRFLQSEIYSHKIWSMVTFWQEALSLTIVEHICESEQVLIRLDDFGMYMLMLGLSYDASVRIIQRHLENSFEWYTDRNVVCERLIKGLDVAAERQLRYNSASLKSG